VTCHRVLCVGMRRAGSTVQTQLVAAILGVDEMHSMTPDTFGSFWRTVENDDRPIVAKCHEFFPEAVSLLQSGKVKIVYIYRDLRDVICSIVRKYGSSPLTFIHGGTASLIEEYKAWTSIDGIYVARYEDMMQDLRAEVLRLASHLNVKLEPGKADELATRFSTDEQKKKIQQAVDAGSLVGSGRNQLDPKTLLHVNHIQSGVPGDFTRMFTRFEIAAVERQCHDWLVSHGYRPATSRTTQFIAHSYYAMRSALNSIRRLVARKRVL
jgi:hypothetical protein